MLHWSNSLWLLLIPVIPLIRLLHQIRSTKNIVFVSSLLFWSPENNKRQTTQPIINTPNKTWILRATIAGILILSAATPYWETKTESSLHIWFDDSISMQTQEKKGTRTSIAIDHLLNKVKGMPVSNLTIHSLTTANKPNLTLHRNDYENWRAILSNWLTPNSTTLQLPTHIKTIKGVHWLITDSADHKINQWYTKNPISQLLTIGSKTENSAIISFSIRPEINNSHSLEAITQIFHDGGKTTNRTLQLFSGKDILKQWELKLSPNESKQVQFKIDLSSIQSEQLLLQFKHSDFLDEDDSLKINSSFYLKAKIIGHCPDSLIRALNSHPYLKTIKESTERVSLTIQCGNLVFNSKTPTLKFHTANQSAINTKPLTWLTDNKTLNNLYLKQEFIQYFLSSSSKENSNSILLAGDTSLINYTKSPQAIVDFYIDIQLSTIINHPEFPVLITGLIDLVTQQSLLDPIKITSRPANESYIRALPITANKQTKHPTYSTNSYSLTPWLISLIFILLLVDWIIMFKRNNIHHKLKQ